jgi:Fe-S-cluster-containing hydrogenase component 2
VQLTQPSYLTKLQEQQFHKLIIGAALKDYKTIEDYAYLFTHAGADAIDISAFPHSVISAQKGIKQAIQEDINLNEPLIMVSVNIGEDPHFRRIELNLENCTECLACVPSCPSQAFTLDQFTYNEDLCFGCSACLPTCNFDALSFVSWSAFDSKSLSELQALGANAIEIHLNNDLDAFAEFYRNMSTEFKLESFCIGSDQMEVPELQAAARRIIEEVNHKHGLNRAFIIQCDGTPMSGARDLGLDTDMRSINNARLILDTIQTYYPNRSNIYIQLAGGITEASLAKAKNHGVPVNGVAIGSYARKKLSEIDSKLDQIQSAKELILASVV